MPHKSDPVQPTPFDVAPATAAASAQPASKTQRSSAPWLAIALGLLLLLALAVFLWLPKKVYQEAALTPAKTTIPVPVPTDTEPTPEPAQGGAASTAVPAEEAPWEEALQAKMRKEAQGILEPLLDLQLTLQEEGVEIWAPRDYAAALALAESGDALYKQRQFEAAGSRYAEALSALQTLDNSRPQRLQQLLEQAQQALEELDQRGANSALQTLNALAPSNPEAGLLSERAKQIPQLLKLFSTATTAESNGQLNMALDALAAAKSLDPEHQRATSEWLRIHELVQNQQYQQAMSLGYSALASGELSEARKMFQRAQSLRPNSPEVSQALLQVQDSGTASTLTSLNDKGRRLEQQERWQQAVNSYRKALKLDNTVLFAAEGLARATPRATLDKQLSELIDQPQRLSDAAVAKTVAAQLQQAQTVRPQGPRLQQQIENLQTLLQQANTPVAVTLLSDAQTEVVLHKVARLGRFNEKPMALRPGTYTATGSRIGYRDVRIVFTVTAGAAAPISIACSEPVP